MNRVSKLMISLALVGCGGTTNKVANQPVVYQQGEDTDPKSDVNFSCLSSKRTEDVPTAPTMLTMTVKDFQDGDPVEGATVEVYGDLAKVNAKTPDAKSAPTDAMGKTMITIPAGHARVIFRTTADPLKTIETFEFNRKFNDAERVSVSIATKQVVPALVGITPDDAFGTVAGSQRDCDGKETGGVTIELTSTGGPIDLTDNSVYFVSVGGSPAPARNQKWTTGIGIFAALNVPPGDVTVSTFGVLAAGKAASKLGTGLIPVRANSITVVELQPL